jgi:hypothetical protein
MSTPATVTNPATTSHPAVPWATAKPVSSASPTMLWAVMCRAKTPWYSPWLSSGASP